jgi:hypothetical protein
MKRSSIVVAVLALMAGCASNSPPLANDTAPPTQFQITDDRQPPPRLSVGVSYPDTRLILPWFLNDIIDFVNYR